MPLITPKKAEVDACLPWLREELRLVKLQAILRAPDGEARQAEREAFVDDHRVAATHL